MTKIYAVLSLAVISGNLHYEDNEDCKTEAVKACKFPTNETLGGLDGLMPNDSFLSNHCGMIIEKIDCLVAEQKSCTETDTMSPDFKFLKDYIQELCKEDSQLRKDFVTSGACLNSNYDLISYKLRNAPRMLQEFHNCQKLEKFQISSASYALSCLRVENFLSELEITINGYCGKTAVKIISDVSGFLSDNKPERSVRRRRQTLTAKFKRV